MHLPVAPAINAAPLPKKSTTSSVVVPTPSRNDPTAAFFFFFWRQASDHRSSSLLLSPRLPKGWGLKGGGPKISRCSPSPAAMSFVLLFWGSSRGTVAAVQGHGPTTMRVPPFRLVGGGAFSLSLPSHALFGWSCLAFSSFWWSCLTLWVVLLSPPPSVQKVREL